MKSSTPYVRLLLMTRVFREAPASESTGTLESMALAFTVWSERWLPDAFIFALIGTALVVMAALTATESTLTQVVDAWGQGFWDLIPFTLQMSLVIITGHVLATSRQWAAHSQPSPPGPRPRGRRCPSHAVCDGDVVVNWGFSLVFSAVLGRKWPGGSTASTTAPWPPPAFWGSAAFGRRGSADRRAANGNSGRSSCRFATSWQTAGCAGWHHFVPRHYFSLAKSVSVSSK